jgi:flagella basal body P-ring formation protein FlgA
MQMLCRLLTANFWHPWLGGLALLAGSLLPGQAGAQAVRVPAPPPVAPSATAAAAAASPQEKMLTQVRQWVAQSQNVLPAQVEVLPIDPRVKVLECPQALAIDLPFASRESVRVRCTQPPWQLYLRVQTTGAGAPASLPSPAPSPTPTPAQLASAAAAAAVPLNRTIVVARHLIQRGTLLQPAMLEEVNRPAQGLDPQALSSLKDVLYGEATRDLTAGQVLKSSDIRRAVLVKQGQSALMSVGQDKGFQITVRVEALQDGRMGEQIRLKNPESGRLLTGTVTGPNTVRGF